MKDSWKIEPLTPAEIDHLQIAVTQPIHVSMGWLITLFIMSMQCLIYVSLTAYALFQLYQHQVQVGQWLSGYAYRSRGALSIN